MKTYNFEEILACPVCKKPIKNNIHDPTCKLKGVTFKKVDGIWDFVSMTQKSTPFIKYEKLHQEGSWGRISDGSYEILASFSRGNKALDVASGEGWIENLAPETVALDFSLSALKKAKKRGAKHLILADAEALPFADNSFDIAICSGSLEHFPNPQKAIKEMARVSRIQVLTVHRYPPVPFAPMLHALTTRLFNIAQQPIEKPISKSELIRMLQKAGLHVVFEGVWTLPVNYGRVIKVLPEFKNIPSCWFVISIKKNQK